MLVDMGRKSGLIEQDLRFCPSESIYSPGCVGFRLPAAPGGWMRPCCPSRSGCISRGGAGGRRSPCPCFCSCSSPKKLCPSGLGGSGMGGKLSPSHPGSVSPELGSPAGEK